MEKTKDESQSRAPAQRNQNLSPAVNSVFTPLRMFDELFRGIMPSSEGTEQFLLVPRVDVEDRDNEYCVTLDIPGVPRENISVEVVDNQLTVSAERVVENQENRRGSRIYGSFQRTLMLPSSVDSEQIQAEYENGVLTLHIPRNEKSRTKRIEVTGKSSLSKPGEAKKSQDRGTDVH